MRRLSRESAAANLIPEKDYPKTGYYASFELSVRRRNGEIGMAWNEKYWDIISNLYWTPRYLGLQSISREKWTINGDHLSIPLNLIANTSGPLYSRSRKFGETKEYLRGQEEVLNQVFNLAFSIVGDEVVSKLLCEPLGIDDVGPFDSAGRDIGARFGWRESENVTQQDGFFITPTSLVGVELKLGSKSWPEQIAKYVALMIWEQKQSGRRTNLGLLFIIPEAAKADHWKDVGLNDALIDATFIDKLKPEKLSKKITNLFAECDADLRDILNRLRLAVVSWQEFQSRIAIIESAIDDGAGVGDQTLKRLLQGLLAQVNSHDKTGLHVDISQSKSRRFD